MKKTINKFLISLSAFILVLSFSFTHLNTSKRFEVQAETFSMTQQVAAVIAVLLASVGIQIVNEPTLDQMQDIYDSLSIEAQGVLSSPTLGNNIVNGMIALPYAQAQTAIHSLVNDFNLDLLTPLTDYFIKDGSILDTAPLVFTLSSTRTILRNDAYVYHYEDAYAINNKTIKLKHVECLWSGVCGVTINFTQYNINDKLSMSLAYVPLSYLTQSSVYSSDPVSKLLKPTDLVLGLKLIADGAISYLIPYDNGSLYFTKTYMDQFLTIDNAIPIIMGADGLTLPAPSNGWDNSEAGDIDLEGWTKGLNIPDVGDVVVLGGLAAGTLAGLSPEAVLVPSDSQTPFDPRPEEPDPGDEEPYTPPNNNGSIFFDVVKALAATFGLSMLLEADPVGNVINASQTFLDNVVQTITQAFSTMLQSLMQPLVSAFSVMIQGLFALDIPATQLKIEGIRSAILARIPCVEETLNAWYDIMAVNGSNLISSFTFFGETFSISSGTLLQAFQGFGSLIKQAFRFVFWFIFLKGMRRRVTSFLGLVSAER